MELLVGLRPGNELRLIEPLFNDFHQFSAQVIQGGALAGIDQGEFLGQAGIMKPVPGPAGKFILIFGIIKQRTQQPPQK